MDDYRRKVVAHYGPAVDAYRRYWAPALRSFARPLLEKLKPGIPPAETRAAQPLRCLDLGCGVGSLAEDLHELAGRESTLIAGDITREMLEAARRPATVSAAGRLDLVLFDAARLPFSDRCLDLIVSAFVLHHVREQHRALAEACRVLKAGGRLGLATWGSRDEGNAAFRVFDELLAEFGAPESDPLRLDAWTDEISEPERLNQLLRSVGFDAVETWTESPEFGWTAGSLFGYRTGLGNASRRLARLPRARQAAFRSTLAGRLAALAPGDFAWRVAIIYAVASVK